jgi:hypothetical protein
MIFEIDDQSFNLELRLLPHQHNGDPNNHTAAIELLEINITTYKTTESSDEVVDYISSSQTDPKNTITPFR